MAFRFILLTMAALFLKINYVQAQEEKKDPRFMLGFNAGANFSRISNNSWIFS